MITNEEKLKDYKELITKKLDEYIPEGYPESIFKSMRYSVLADGKRIRPILAIEAFKLFSQDLNIILPSACAVEMLHAQSLIHDDLPCMDNDDFRRGKPTNHKVFGEAMATLAGDALLSFAPQIIIEKTPKSISAEKILRIIGEFMKAAGAYGIIAGQVVDIESEGKQIDEKTLDFIHQHKTADMFRFPIRAGAILGGANEDEIEKLTEYADKIGLAFQIADDILDETATLETLGKTPGKDKAVGKATYTSIHGIENAKEALHSLIVESCDIIKDIGNSNAERGLLLYITELIETRMK